MPSASSVSPPALKIALSVAASRFAAVSVSAPALWRFLYAMKLATASGDATSQRIEGTGDGGALARLLFLDGSWMVIGRFMCTSCTSWRARPARVMCTSCTGASPARVLTGARPARVTLLSRVDGSASIASMTMLYSTVKPFRQARRPVSRISPSDSKSSMQTCTVRRPISRSSAMLCLLVQMPVPSSLAHPAMNIRTAFRVGEPTLRRWTMLETTWLTLPPRCQGCARAQNRILVQQRTW